MTCKLYNRDGSGGFVVEAALTIAEAPFELVTLDSKPSTPLPESFRAVNPRGQVPVLITPDGTMMTESAAILIHLAACHPDSGLGPRPGTSEHARFLRWLVFMSVNLYEGLLHQIYADRFTTDPDGRAGVAKAAARRLKDSFAILERALEADAFLLGGEMSAADLYLAMLNAWYGAGRGLPRCEALTHRAARHPVIAPVWQRNFDDRLATNWGRSEDHAS